MRQAINSCGITEYMYTVHCTVYSVYGTLYAVPIHSTTWPELNTYSTLIFRRVLRKLCGVSVCGDVISVGVVSYRVGARVAIRFGVRNDYKVSFVVLYRY